MEAPAVDRALQRVAAALYCCLVIVMLLGFLPGVRQRAWQWLRWHLWAYELGQVEVRSDRARGIYRRIMDAQKMEKPA